MVNQNLDHRHPYLRRYYVLTTEYPLGDKKKYVAYKYI